MVELVVALLAGLLVAAGIVTLSREATNTFHEEARASAAEAGLRAAIDRLRADLQRGGFMSTGNIVTDPMIAAAPGAAHYAAATAPAAIQTLASILYSAGGSLAKNLTNASPALTTEQSPALAPDLIDIGGNLTTADQFDVAYIAPAVGNCTTIYLSPTSPAMYRIMGNGTAGATELLNIFQPDPTYAQEFIVRLVDDSGHTQFLETCGSGASAPGAVAGVVGGQPYVSVNTQATPLQMGVNTGTVGGLVGFAAGRAWVNPVQIVQWEITSSSSTNDPEPAQFLNGLEATSNGATDPTKYDLMRSLLDATGVIVPSTSEIVAEYAVDLGFAFSVDTGTALLPNVVTYPFNNPSNVTAAGAVSNPSATPERIRTVRARLAVRTAQPDRSVGIGLLPANYGSETYLYRYCVASCPSPPASALAWARVRTVTTEVDLPNQSANYY